MHPAAFKSLLFLAIQASLEAQLLVDFPVYRLEPDGTQPAVLHLATQYGLFRTGNGGTSWEQVPVVPMGQLPPPIRSIATVETHPAIMFLGTSLSSGGVFKSENSGRTWRPANSGLDATAGYVNEIYPIRGNPNIVYAVVTEESSGRQRLYKSADGGQSWTERPEVPGRLTMTRVHPPVMYAARGLQVLRSTDDGATWTTVGAVRPPVSNNDINGAVVQVAPSDASTLVAVCNGPSDWANGIFSSRDGGVSWTRRSQGNGIGVWINPYRSHEMFVGSPISSSSFRRSSDGGQNWSSGAVLSSFSGGAINSFAFAAADTATVYALLSTGMFRSTDSGVTWARLGTLRPSVYAAPFSLAGRFLSGVPLTGSRTIRIDTVEKAGLKLPFTIVAGGEPWIKLSSTQGVTGDAITVTWDTTQMIEGTHQAAFRIQTPGTVNSDQEITVSAEMAGTPASSFLHLGPYRGWTGGSPRNLAFDAAGNLYVSEQRDGLIKRVDVLGQVTVVAGGGSNPLLRGSARATEVELRRPWNIAADPDGTLYFIERDRSMVRKVNPQGIMSTIAGTADTAARDQDGIAATAARLPLIQGLASDGAGTIYFTSFGRVRRVRPDGLLQTYAGGGYENRDNTIATSVALDADDIALDNEGNLYVTESKKHRIRKIDKNWLISTVAGTGGAGDAGDGGPARQAQLNSPSSIAVDRAGVVYFWDSGNYRVRRITQDGRITTVAGNGLAGLSPACAEATFAPLSLDGLAVAPNGSLVISGQSAGRVHEIFLPQAIPDRVPSFGGIGLISAAGGMNVLAPGAVMDLTGSNLAPAAEQAARNSWPSTLGGVRVCANQFPAPLFATTADRLTAQLPYEVGAGSAVVRLYHGGGAAAFPVAVSQASPGLYSTVENRAVALNEDGSLNSPDHPSAPGSTFTVYLTGQGMLDNALASGAGAPAEPLSRPVLPVTARLGDQPIEVLDAFMTPGEVGLLQVIARMPEMEPGDYSLVILVGDAPSNAVLFAAGPKVVPESASRAGKSHPSARQSARRR